MVHRPARTLPNVSPRAVADRRLRIFSAVVLLGLLAVAGRMFILQVLSHDTYAALAEAQHGIAETLSPERGGIFIRDPKSSSGVFSVATNRTLYTVFATPPDIKDPAGLARQLAPILQMDELALREKLAAKPDPYVPLKKQADEDAAAQIKKLGARGIGMEREERRFYPETSLLSHALGFVASDDQGQPIGRYGIEGHWNKELAGSPGYLSFSQSGLSRLLGDGSASFSSAEPGADVILSIERPIQYFACEKLRQAIAQHGASGGSVIIVRPKTGAVLAMCSAPDFDPNAYAQAKDISVFNNPVTFGAYEPGSVFKAFTMAGAIDSGKVSPGTTYTDEGEVKLGPYTIRNSDLKSHGVQTMTQVLEKSLNTGTVHVAHLMGPELFKKYVEQFGFGRTLGIELDTESAGNTSALSKKGDIWSATGSFGQGITTTPLQLAMGYAAIANGGTLMQPTVVDTVRFPDGRSVKTQPIELRQAVSKRTAGLVSGMLVDVVENGHGKRAGVPGYYVAGKTGTAQIPRKDGPGYEVGPTIGTFAGFAPVNDPAFAMVVKIDRPQGVNYAESTAAPLFGEIAKFLLQYFEIPAERK